MKNLPLVALGLLACTGDIRGAAGPGAVSSQGDEPAPVVAGPAGAPRPGMTPVAPIGPGTPPGACAAQAGPAPLRRLTHREFDNTVRALLGDNRDLGRGFPSEEEILGFDNNAEGRVASDLLVEDYLDASELLVTRAVADLPRLLGCPAAVLASTAPAAMRDGCVTGWIASFGKRAWRRPVEAADHARLMALYTTGQGRWSFEVGVKLALQAILLSPQFLYKLEAGQTATRGGTGAALEPYELAARLSYFLWAGPPDDELVRAAETGKLATRAEVAAQATRMMKDPRTRAMLADFHRQWLSLDEIDKAEKDAAMFKSFTADVRTLLHQETAQFIDNAVWSGKGDLATLLTAPFSYMNAKLATYYGAKGPIGENFEMVMLDPAQRSGLLTHAGILAATAHANQTSPVHRGMFVRKRLFCTPPPPPPDDVEILAPKLDPRLTTRERFAEHAREPACAGCHKLMDPIGLGFEKYDPIGRWRATESGKMIDATGEMFSSDVDGRFDGAVELTRKLGGSRQVSDCVTLQWFRYAHGRDTTAADECTIKQLAQRFAASKGDLRDLVFAITQTDAFSTRPVVVAGGAP